ncbi:MAG: M23 family metallopeptidase [Saprospiraceae bacterium]
MKRALSFILLCVVLLAFDNSDTPALKKYPKQYFRSPVNHSMLLSGTFGELRPNHFHAGIDIKSAKGVPGDDLFTAADGFISRIKVDSRGYGNSLYIDHPNGYTTLYAHLDHFSEEIAAYVKAKQYEQQSFEVDLDLTPDIFPVRQGQRIGAMGNSGSSNGAHLHFEIRDTRTQDPINPLLFGFPVVDNVSPRMHSVKVYQLDQHLHAKGARAYSVYQSNGNYRIKGDTIYTDGDRAGFGLKVYDHFDRVSNWNGIYSLSMLKDDSLIYAFDLETFSFDETRYLNAHCDYEERVTKNSYYNRCFTLPGNQLSIYRKNKNYGVVEVPERRPAKITMIASDVAGNEARLEFWVQRKQAYSAVAVSNELYNYILPYDEGNMIRTEGLYLHMPAGTLYEDLYLRYDVSPERSDGYYSDVHHVHEPTTPVHQFFDLGLRPTKPIPAELKSKVFVAYCNGNSMVNCGGTWQDGLLMTKVRQFGNYCIMADTKAPTITPLSFRYNMKGRSKMSFRIKDETATAANVDDLSYDAWVDDQWILMEYDKKSASITHEFDEHIGPGEHSLKIVVRDAVGNEKVYESKFVR